jgi:hypothetical protein
MPEGYKVRLGDGSEIGPLDLQGVRDWHRQGFLEPKSQVLRPGSTHWTTLDQVLEPQAFGRSARPTPTVARAGSAKPAGNASRPAPRRGREARPASSRPALAVPWRALLIGSLAVVAVSAAGYFAYEYFVAETPRELQVREVSAPDRSYADDDLGVRLDLPRRWRILRKDQSLVQAPAEARLVLAQPRANAFGFFIAESAPAGVASLDQYLDRILERRRRIQPALQEGDRSGLTVSGLSGRQATSTWTSADGVRYRERDAVWKDGWVYFAVAGWTPEEDARASREIDALLGGIKSSGSLDARLRRAVQAVTAEVPMLTAPAAEILMGRSQARVLEPDQAFRRGVESLTKALPTFAPADVKEVGQLTSTIYAGLPAKDRNRLASYINRVRAGRLTTPQEDKDLGQVMKGAVLRLPAPQRLRFQKIVERAVLASTAGA